MLNEIADRIEANYKDLIPSVKYGFWLTPVEATAIIDALRAAAPPSKMVEVHCPNCDEWFEPEQWVSETGDASEVA